MNRPSVPPPETTPSWAAGARRRAPLYLALALLLALLAGFLTFLYLDQVRAASVPTARALVALQDLRPGTIIDQTMVEVRDVPEALAPAQRLTEASQAVGRAALFPLAAGEVLLPSKLASGPGGGLSSRLPDGKWAIVLPASWLASPVPEITAGDRIELLAYQPGASQEDAGLIVSAVEVLAFSGTNDGATTLTLAVTLDEARAILYARSNGFSLLALLRRQGG